MKVTILGSCTVIDFPQQVDRFFHQGNLVDIRNGSLMEMDSLPLYFLAKHKGDQILVNKLVNAIDKNLIDSHDDIWHCGIWGCNETHLRFSNIALRFIMFNQCQYEQTLLGKCFLTHLSQSELLSKGRWFYHDSIETDKLAFYPTWQGKPCMGASPHNMLILNTHLDTLTTLFIARKLSITLPNIDQTIQTGLQALSSYFTETVIVGSILSKIDSTIRNIALYCATKDNRASGLVGKVITRFYYYKLRYWLKKRMNIRAFSDGFLERDVRLLGNNLEYHVVNLWDMAKLVLWMHYNHWHDPLVEKQCQHAVLNGLKYCASALFFKRYIKTMSRNKGSSNEVLEAIVMMIALGHKDEWLISLYFEYRQYAPPSCAIMGIDSTVSGIINEQQIEFNSHEVIDCDVIPFAHGITLLANHSKQTAKIKIQNLNLCWGKVSTELQNNVSDTNKIVMAANTFVVVGYQDKLNQFFNSNNQSGN